MNIKSRAKKIIRRLALSRNRKTLVPVSCLTDNRSLLSNKVALIIGGTGDIGFSIAESFIESDCRVILAGTDEVKLKKAAETLNSDFVKTLVLELQSVQMFEGKIEYAINLFGHIDILVNAAGIHSANCDFWKITEGAFDNILEINLKGTYFLERTVAQHMIKQKIKGHILNITSSVVQEPAWSPYRISKLGVNGYTRGLAMLLQPYGIIVNAIAPGSVATKLVGYQEGMAINTDDNRVGRYIVPEEVAEYVKLLVSDLGDMIVGDTLFISGGRGTIEVR